MSPLGKLLWDLLFSTKYGSLSSVNDIKRNYILNAPFLRGSYVWNSILKARHDLLLGFRFKVGNGATSFWFTYWLGIGPLCMHVPYVDIHDVDASIRDVKVDNMWHLERLWTPIPHDIKERVLTQEWNLVIMGIPVTAICLAGLDIGGGATKWITVLIGCLGNLERAETRWAPNHAPRLVKWDPPSRDQVALNTDSSVSSTNVGFGGLVRRADGEWITSFYGSLGNGDIIRAELFAILQGLQLCWDLSFKNIKCMIDSQHALTLISGDGHRHSRSFTVPSRPKDAVHLLLLPSSVPTSKATIISSPHTLWQPNNNGKKEPKKSKSYSRNTEKWEMESERRRRYNSLLPAFLTTTIASAALLTVVAWPSLRAISSASSFRRTTSHPCRKRCRHRPQHHHNRAFSSQPPSQIAPPPPLPQALLPS
ncbi:Ribonuclease H-like superfamily [Sesbania bispinosa]|nr:Ribonuclease H-like superfamily [Sesbania bispinosa]